MYRLEKYNGKNRYRCPKCGTEREFVRYVDESGEHLSPEVGRCNREVKCSYHYTPRQFFADNPTYRIEKRQPQARSGINTAQVVKAPDNLVFIPVDVLKRSITAYEQNNFVEYLRSLLPADVVNEALRRYFVGTWKDGRTVFWQIDAQRRIRTGKLMTYDAVTGKRNKARNLSWVHSELKRTGELPADFNLKQCLFGEHLLSAEPNNPIAIAESEKTAIVASLFMPRFVWLATGGGNNLRAEQMANALGDRRIVLFPDSSKFTDWKTKAEEARRRFNLDVRVSDLFERRLTEEQKREDSDIADFLIPDKQKQKSES